MTIKTRMTATMAAVLLAGAATAVSAAEIDTDGDGVYSLAEMQAAFPEITEETFTAIDANGDGMVDPDELKAAQDAGVLPSGG